MAKYKDNKKIKYQVFSKVITIKQPNTIINLTNVQGAEMYSHIDETLQNRFTGYKLHINHIDKTVNIDY